ncbi:hypothetical protein [Actinomadura flavalba]|uniref:hypothetical protein n=1 Tax=Actinomadura flavalba TaxID=1120938 RepID=UPI0012DFC29F|nr:hypothetical protein [Actinomadura flavalba]
MKSQKLEGNPRFVTRQFTNPHKGAKEVKYVQVVAVYPDSAAAMAAFDALKKSAHSCPPRRHVPAKKVRENFTRYAHDDTWKVSEPTDQRWTRLQGQEVQKYAASASQYNWLHLIYDFAVRGNTFLAMLYWGRTEPKKSPQKIIDQARSAVELQLKQFQ